MHLRSSLFLALPLVLLSGCSVGTSLLTKPTAPLDITGNWQLNSTSTTQKVVVSAATFKSAQGVVSGFAEINGSCYLPGDLIPLGGSVDSRGNVTMTSVVFQGQTFALTGVVAADGASISGGAYTVHGGCADGARGSITGASYQPLTGTYTGPVLSESGTTVQVTAHLSQSATADASGVYLESGSAVFTGSPCFSATTIDSSSTMVFGGSLVLGLKIDPQTEVTISGTFDPLAKAMQLHYSVAGGLCGGDSGAGTLTRQ